MHQHLTIHDLPKIQQPRERLKALGPSNLDTDELIALILGTGTKDLNVKALASQLIKQFPLAKLLDASVTDLTRFKGLGPVKAGKLIACLELAKRAYAAQPAKYVNSPQTVCQEVADIRNDRKEHLIALYLNARHELVDKQTLAIGNLNQAILEARDVFAPAFLSPSAYIILVHNHPSGDPNPSDADAVLTQRLIKAGELLGIKILDHIVVTRDDFFSFKEAGLL